MLRRVQPRASRRYKGVLALAPALFLAPSCLDDLPEPATCPPPSRIEVGDCVQTLSAFDFDTCFVDGLCCLDAAASSCLLGDRPEGCACAAGECPTSSDACYPDGDCPLAVTDAVGDAVCVRMPDGSIQGGAVLSEAQCLCGCSSCASVCDGKGVAMGAYVPTFTAPDGTLVYQPIPVVLDLTNELPASGRLGFYVRTRGIGELLVQVSGGPTGEDFVIYLIDHPLGGSSEFSETILFRGSPLIPAEPFSWSEPASAPNLAVLAFNASDEAPTLVEIDCIVPFVVDP